MVEWVRGHGGTGAAAARHDGGTGGLRSIGMLYGAGQPEAVPGMFEDPYSCAYR